ncbi:MAG: hypothetical protein ACYDDF_07475 [Thermoplasmatota archaeon]
MNVQALLAVIVFAGVLLAIFGILYRIARRAREAGEIDDRSLRVLRMAFLGHVVLNAILVLAALAAPPT